MIDNPFQQEPEWKTLMPDEYELAITGKAFEYMLSMEQVSPTFAALTKEVIKKAKIYARMSPDHKEMLITQLQEKTSDIIGM